MERITELERAYVAEVLNSNFRSSSGAKMMKRLEQTFRKVYGANHAISFVNGTSTMHAALEAIEIRPGDEVIVPPLTMASTAMVVLQANATPIFADVDSKTFQIDPGSIEEKITPRTRAIITVALYGGAPDLPKIRKICDKHELFLIEDNAECFLGKIKNEYVGSYGEFASFSFQSSKHLTAGEGGILLVKSDKHADRVRSVQSLGYSALSGKKSKIDKETIQHFSYNRHSRLGWNYRMPELCCAVALGQTERINELVGHRLTVAEIFKENTKELEGTIIRSQKNYPHSENTYWTWVMSLDTSKVDWSTFRRKFIANNGDPFYGAWQLTYLEPMFKNFAFLGRENFINERILKSYKPGLCPNAENLQPTLMQFKTNYWSLEEAEKNAKCLNKTIKSFL